MMHPLFEHHTLATVVVLVCAACAGTTSNASGGGSGTGGEGVPSDASGGSAGTDAGSGGSDSTPGTCGADVQFADPLIEQVIRIRLAQPSGPISGQDLLGIGDLGVPSSMGAVTSLTGVECLVNLTALGMPPGSITSLAPLAGLNELVTVVFPDNRVTDLSPLSDKSRLRDVSASGNSVTTLGNLTLPMRECGSLDLIGNPLSAAAQVDLDRFCADGWYVWWGEPAAPNQCNEQCIPRP